MLWVGKAIRPPGGPLTTPAPPSCVLCLYVRELGRVSTEGPEFRDNVPLLSTPVLRPVFPPHSLSPLPLLSSLMLTPSPPLTSSLIFPFPFPVTLPSWGAGLVGTPI